MDKSKKTVFIIREFDAELSLVLDAFTRKEILYQWWAPQPWSYRTKYMNFEPGGKRFYEMVSPEGHEHWAIQHYTAVTPKTHYQFISVFADENEKPDLPGSQWDLHFSEETDKTKIANKSFEAI